MKALQKQMQRKVLYALPIIGIVSLITACGSSQVSQNAQTELDYRQQAKEATQAIN
jgi:major membrane immunogen (membrane-anchored lipoprotein)